MGFIVKGSNSTGGGGGDFKPVPEGQYQLVCVDYVDYGMKPSTFNGVTTEKHKIGIVFQVNLQMDSGHRYLLTEQFTASLHENGKLRPFLESWRGKKFSDTELAGFDLENLIGVNAYSQVVHNEWQGKTFANIQSIMPLNPSWNMARMEPENYTRKKDREPQQARMAPPSAPAPPPPPPVAAFPSPVPSTQNFDDDDIPF